MKKLLLVGLVFCFAISDEFFEPATTIGGYGEMHYDIEANDGDGKLDFHRFIIYYKHQFSPKWSMMSEVEIEHNMVGSEEALGYKGGYVAMEQAYVDYFNGNWGFRGGVLLVPAGITNEYHEPPTFMSVERPEYNKNIIPTTWFDNGFAFYGSMGDFNLNLTLTGDLDGDAIGDGIRSARKKGHYSKASSWTKTLQGSWTGMEGLKVGGSITMNDAPTSAVEASTEHTWEYIDTDNDDVADAWGDVITEISGVEAGTIGVNLTEFNATYLANNMYARIEHGKIDYTDNPSADSSSGYYLDLGYNIADLVGCDDSDLYLWMRNSTYNKDDDDDTQETTISLFGVTYKPLDNISFKFEMGTSSKNDVDTDVMRVGLGYMF